MWWYLVSTDVTLEIWWRYEYSTLGCFRAGSVAVQNIPMHVRRSPWRTMSEFRNKVGKIWIECAKTIRIKREHGLRTKELFSVWFCYHQPVWVPVNYLVFKRVSNVYWKKYFNDMTTWSFLVIYNIYKYKKLVHSILSFYFFSNFTCSCRSLNNRSSIYILVQSLWQLDYDTNSGAMNIEIQIYF